MLITEDTIVAISTPLGEGGIGIVRLSGPDSISILSKLFKPYFGKDVKKLETRKLYLGNIVEPKEKQIVDEVLVSIFKKPHTYTREDMVEINCHGGLVAQKKILRLAIGQGARLADPGEFTKRAFLNGRIDLSQAEAVIDVIRAKTDRALTLANKQLSGGLSEKIKEIRESLLNTIAHIEANIDYPEDDIPEISLNTIKLEITENKKKVKTLLDGISAGKVLREGMSTLILGNTNVGKSSLLNALVRDERAIVTDIPGTTRDVIEEYIDIKGVPIKIIDTAGIRETADMVEKIGIDRAIKYLEDAELVLLMIDVSKDLTDDDKYIINLAKDKLCITVFNKIDLPQVISEKEITKLLPNMPIVKISALKEKGIDKLKSVIYDTITQKIGLSEETSFIAGERQRLILEETLASLERALVSIKSQIPIEMVEIDIRDAWEKLGEITGETIDEDILGTIFENFCVGK